MMVPALVPEEAARRTRQETPTAPRQTLTWGESLAGSHVAPKSPGLPNCKRKGSKKARFTGQGFRDARSCSSPFPWNHPSCPVQCMNVHTWMEMGEQKQGCEWLWWTRVLAAVTRNNTMPTLRTRKTLSQQDCLPKKVKSLTCGKPNPMR